MKTLVLNFEDLANGKAIKAMQKAFARVGTFVVTAEADPKVKTSAGVKYKTLNLSFNDGQKVSLDAKSTGDVFQVRVNGKVIPIKNHENIDKAIVEIVNVLDKGRAKFQAKMTRVKVELPKGLKSTAKKQHELLKETVSELDMQIEEATQRRDALKAEMGLDSVALDGVTYNNKVFFNEDARNGNAPAGAVAYVTWDYGRFVDYYLMPLEASSRDEFGRGVFRKKSDYSGDGGNGSVIKIDPKTMTAYHVDQSKYLESDEVVWADKIKLKQLVILNKAGFEKAYSGSAMDAVALDGDDMDFALDGLGVVPVKKITSKAFAKEIIKMGEHGSKHGMLGGNRSLAGRMAIDLVTTVGNVQVIGSTGDEFADYRARQDGAKSEFTADGMKKIKRIAESYIESDLRQGVNIANQSISKMTDADWGVFYNNLRSAYKMPVVAFDAVAIDSVHPAKVKVGDDVHNPKENRTGMVRKITGKGLEVRTTRGLETWDFDDVELVQDDDAFDGIGGKDANIRQIETYMQKLKGELEKEGFECDVTIYRSGKGSSRDVGTSYGEITISDDTTVYEYFKFNANGYSTSYGTKRGDRRSFSGSMQEMKAAAQPILDKVRKERAEELEKRDSEALDSAALDGIKEDFLQFSPDYKGKNYKIKVSGGKVIIDNGDLQNIYKPMSKTMFGRPFDNLQMEFMPDTGKRVPANYDAHDSKKILELDAKEPLSKDAGLFLDFLRKNVGETIDPFDERIDEYGDKNKVNTSKLMGELKNKGFMVRNLGKFKIAKHSVAMDAVYTVGIFKSDSEGMKAIAAKIQEELAGIYGYVSANAVTILGQDSVSIKATVEPKSDWINNIIHNATLIQSSLSPQRGGGLEFEARIAPRAAKVRAKKFPAGSEDAAVKYAISQYKKAYDNLTKASAMDAVGGDYKITINWKGKSQTSVKSKDELTDMMLEKMDSKEVMAAFAMADKKPYKFTVDDAKFVLEKVDSEGAMDSAEADEMLGEVFDYAGQPRDTNGQYAEGKQGSLKAGANKIRFAVKKAFKNPFRG